MQLRTLDKNETGLLKDFLYEAIFIPEGVEPPDRSIIEQPELSIYYEDFGSGKADNCIVADDNGKVIGAVWTRIMNDYGHVDDETPSFAISLYKEYRGQGIGTDLMKQMLSLLKEQGYKKASLAVQKANYAVKMYKKVGFEIVDENSEEYIMVCDLIKDKIREEIEYRQVRKEDGYEWYKLLDEVWRVAYNNILPKEVFDARDNAREDRARGFSEDKFLGERKIAYVAVHEGKIVGLMFGTLDSDYEYFKDKYADLVALYVYPDYQGKGIGTSLRDIFIEWAKEKNADQYVIGVLKENTKARKVYESWGGKLSEHEHDFVQMNVGYPEVFYTFKL
ncbi:MAG: GNAT family N-acetyltransferase [Eubacterium sp.]|nr:GNAT family N-acetyltransferase [Eubacterium sp.]